MIFKVKFQRVRASPKYVILTSSGIWFLSPNYSRNFVEYTFTRETELGHDLGTISETIKKPASSDESEASCMLPKNPTWRRRRRKRRRKTIHWHINKSCCLFMFFLFIILCSLFLLARPRTVRPILWPSPAPGVRWSSTRPRSATWQPPPFSTLDSLSHTHLRSRCSGVKLVL